MKLNESILNIAAAPTAVFKPAVSSGLRLFSLFGGTLAASLANLAIPGEGSSVLGTPTILTAGMQGDNNNTIVLAEGNETGSETLFIVSRTVPTGTLPVASFSAVPLGTLGNYSDGTSFTISTGNAGPDLILGGTGHQPAITAGDGIIGSSLVAQQAISLPQAYCAVIDTSGSLTLSDLSQSGSSWSTAESISGTTRAAFASNYHVFPQGAGQVTNSTTTVYAVVKYNRALSPTECTAVYAQLKRLLAARSVTI